MEAEDRGAIQLGPGEGDSLRVLGELVTRKIAAGRTRGAYSLVVVASRPGGGPSPRVQYREDGSFYVVEGEFEFLMEGGDAARAGTGSLVYVSSGVPHACENVGEGRLLIHTPGGLRERFFQEVGESAAAVTAPPPAREGPPDLAGIAAIAAKYGIEIPRHRRWDGGKNRGGKEET